MICIISGLTRATEEAAPRVRVASKSGEKRLCRLLCGKPLAFRHSPPPFPPPLGWKAKPSSRAEGVSQGASPRKGEAFPHSRRQSRFGMSPFGDFDATLACLEWVSLTYGGLPKTAGTRGTALAFCLGVLMPVHNGPPGRAPQWIAAITSKPAHGLVVADGSHSEVLPAPCRKESSSQLSSVC